MRSLYWYSLFYIIVQIGISGRLQSCENDVFSGAVKILQGGEKAHPPLGKWQKLKNVRSLISH